MPCIALCDPRKRSACSACIVAGPLACRCAYFSENRYRSVFLFKCSAFPSRSFDTENGWRKRTLELRIAAQCILPPYVRACLIGIAVVEDISQFAVCEVFPCQEFADIVCEFFLHGGTTDIIETLRTINSGTICIEICGTVCKRLQTTQAQAVIDGSVRAFHAVDLSVVQYL